MSIGQILNAKLENYIYFSIYVPRGKIACPEQIRSPFSAEQKYEKPPDLILFHLHSTLISDEFLLFYIWEGMGNQLLRG